MDLSVVIATTDASRSIEACLRSLASACAGLRHELIVVDASADDTAARAADLGGATILRHPVGTLTPVLWSEGYRRAAGRHVAFTTGHCVAGPGWAVALRQVLEAGAAGAGGPLTLGRGATALDRAVFYLRYSAFMPSALGQGRIEGEIAGDNAMYDRAWLDAHAGTLALGFWEVDFHRLVRAGGGWLEAVPAARMAFERSCPAGTILRHRFAHGTHCGAGRVSGGLHPLRIAAAAPLVPFVLASRAGRRLSVGDVGRFTTALPWFIALASAWALGEAWGALFGARAQAGHGVRSVHDEAAG